ncbi:recombinase family protein, partial [Enterococcus faecalis]
MRKFFYIRVSSYDQSIERQLIAAKELGIPEEYIFIEKASGKDFKRPEYQLMKRMF